jgi:hypothetical protein
MDLDKWSPRISNNKKKGFIYFKNKKTGQKVWSDSYAPKVDSYTIINTLDGQLKIPEDALAGLNEWSGMFKMFTSNITEESKIPTFNVSSSYLMRIIAISRAAVQYSSLEDEELKEKKKDQIVSMCDHHIRKPNTSFYDEEMEMTSAFFEFMEGIRISETKSTVKSNEWNISDELFRSSGIGRIVDPMDPAFTVPQYITIAALSYFQHLKDTNPESIDTFTIRINVLEDVNKYIDETGNKITTWIPSSIKTEMSDGYRIEPLRLIQFVANSRIIHFSIDDMSHLIKKEYSKLSDTSPNIKKIRDFWLNLGVLIKNGRYPINRVW